MLTARSHSGCTIGVEHRARLEKELSLYHNKLPGLPFIGIPNALNQFMKDRYEISIERV